MIERKIRYPCPVCLGIKLVKLRPAKESNLVVDYCKRCGGIWFDEGEVPLLRQCNAKAFATRVNLRPDVHRMRCHGCGAALERNAHQCQACARGNVLECPGCRKALVPMEREGLRIDICRTCRGAWFDNIELGRIWNSEVTALAQRNRNTVTPAEVAADYFLLDAVLWAPDILVHGAAVGVHAAGSALGTVVEAMPVLTEIGSAAGSVVEGAGDLAGSVFETIAEIIGGLFG
jgi:Zn-finger nucleic acid-binding protein